MRELRTLRQETDNAVAELGLNQECILEALIVQQVNELENAPCEVCGQSEPVNDILICDHCAKFFHF